MIPLTESIERLITRLEKIAKKNRDKFGYKIEINVERNSLFYSFVAFETTDGHEFLTGHGKTIEDAIINADNDVEESCKMWDYKIS